MKKALSLIGIFVLAFIIFTGQKFDNNDPRWNQHPASTRFMAPGQYDNLPSYPNTDNYVNSNTKPQYVYSPQGVMVVTPNYRLHPTNAPGTQSEVNIYASLNNPNLMLGSANIFWGGSYFSCGGYISTNGGTNWYGNDTTRQSSGDPGPIIDKNNVYIISNITAAYSMGATFSTDYGVTWQPVVTFPGATTSADKNLSGTNYAASSPYYGHSYTVYTEFGGSYTNRIVFSRTTNSGVNWSTIIPISPTPASGHHHQGCDVTAGPEGNVYAVWANCTTNGQNSTEDSLGFGKSTDGGITWTSRNNAADMNGIRASSFGPWGIRVAGFPRLDVDRSGGPRNGWIYVVAPEKNFNGGDAADIFLWKSSDQGTTWSTPVRVNQDAADGKLQYHAAINVDAAGGVNVIYHDCRSSNNNDSVDTYVNRSVDGGVTWTEIKVNDAKFRPAYISGLATGYQGDYIGITSGNSKIFPNWSDNRVGRYQSWAATIILDAGPLAPFVLKTPAAGTTVTSYPGSTTPVTITWDTSRAAATYKWIFGTSLPTTRLLTMQSGTNSLTMTLGQLDNMLAGLGVSQGSSISGSWDVWAFRNNAPQNDSLKSSNGPRTITFTRGVPPLTAFNLVNPPNNTTITTSIFNNTNVDINWTRSGQGTTYKWKFGAPTISTPLLVVGSGFDSTVSFVNSGLDLILGNLGVNPGDSISGQWAVWAYNATDSLKSAQTFNIKFKRQGKGDVIILYDSSVVACRTSKDTVSNVLSRMNVTFDVFNRGSGQTSTNALSLRGYKAVMLLGEGTSSLGAVMKDSVKAYLNSGGTTVQTKSKLIIFSEDIGYNFGRSASTYYDTNFVHNYLGWDYTADRPGTGTVGLIGSYINNGLADSTVGSWPDCLKIYSISGAQQHTLYKFRTLPSSTDSVNAIGLYKTNFNVATFGVDIESLRRAGDSPAGESANRMIRAAWAYVNQVLVGVEENGNLLPVQYSLSQNYPNPFNPVTKINFALPKQGLVTLKIYDVLGREVRTVVNEVKAAGYHTVEFNGSNIASGVYFYRLESNGFSDIKKMMLIK